MFFDAKRKLRKVKDINKRLTAVCRRVQTLICAKGVRLWCVNGMFMVHGSAFSSISALKVH